MAVEVRLTPDRSSLRYVGNVLERDILGILPWDVGKISDTSESSLAVSFVAVFFSHFGPRPLNRSVCALVVILLHCLQVRSRYAARRASQRPWPIKKKVAIA